LFLEFVEFFLRADLSRSWQDLLLEPVDNAVLGPLALEIDLIPIDEEEDSWIATHSIRLGWFSLLGGIHLSQFNSTKHICTGGVLGSECLGSLTIGGSQSLAMATPWGVEFDQDVGELSNDVWEVRVVEYQYTGVLSFVGVGDG
jgi:hypothetical protein